MFPAARRALLAARTKGPLWAVSWRWEQQAQRLPLPLKPEGLRQCWMAGHLDPSCSAVGHFQEMDVRWPVLHHTVLICHLALASKPCSSLSSSVREPQASGAHHPGLHPFNRVGIVGCFEPLAGSSVPQPAEEDPGSPDQCPSMFSGFGSVGPQRIQLPSSSFLPQAQPRQLTLTGPSPIRARTHLAHAQKVSGNSEPSIC